MANAVDIKAVVKHIVDGTLAEKLCRICLMPFGNVCENIFTKICKEDTEFCIADVLRNVCNIEFTEADNYSVCIKCFITASAAYKFYLLAQRSTTILNYYVGELEANVNQIDTQIKNSNDCLCITLPVLEPELQNFDFDIKGCMKEYIVEKEYMIPVKREDLIVIAKKEPLDKITVTRTVDVKRSADKYTKKRTETNVMDSGKRMRKRDPMTIKQCSLCPVKYRFISKLQEHMKQQHNIELFVCKICKAVIENEQEFNNHLKTHTNVHRCALCNALFKRRETIIAHLKWHHDMKHLSQSENAHVCEKCGVFLHDEDELKEHNDKKHNKRFTCFYCGRSYRGETSFEMHIKKHELHSKINGSVKEAESGLKENEETSTSQKLTKKTKKRWICASCGRNFVDERALTWHTMLHTNDRPYICETCGRGFVSVNRRNQHSLCAHTAPTKRCPLCPALFHLRSMVNSHIKKVHLKIHKRRNRTSKHQNVFWRTEAVPIQELSVSIQNEILELKTRDLDKSNDLESVAIDWLDNGDVTNT